MSNGNDGCFISASTDDEGFVLALGDLKINIETTVCWCISVRASPFRPLVAAIRWRTRSLLLPENYVIILGNHTHTWFFDYLLSFFLSHTAKNEIFLLPSLELSHHKSHRRFPRARGNSRGKSCWLSWFTVFLTDVIFLFCFFVWLFLFVTPPHTPRVNPRFCSEGPKNTRKNIFHQTRGNWLILLGPAPFPAQPPPRKKERRRSHTPRTKKHFWPFEGLRLPVFQIILPGHFRFHASNFPSRCPL